MKNKRGWSWLETLVVICIIGFLVALIIPCYVASQNNKEPRLELLLTKDGWNVYRFMDKGNWRYVSIPTNPAVKMASETKSSQQLEKP